MSCLACFNSDPCCSSNSWSWEFIVSGKSIELFNDLISCLWFKHKSFNFSTYKPKNKSTYKNQNPKRKKEKKSKSTKTLLELHLLPCSCLQAST
jgi:hypothetical protein